MAVFRDGGRPQLFEWGSLLWFYEPTDLDIERLSVGLVTIDANSTNYEHLHSGDEQVIYVISGRGQQFINGEEERIHPGDVRHIPPYARHEVINSGPDELKLIIVYTPSKFQQLLAQTEVQHSEDAADFLHYIDVVSLTEVLNKFSEAIGLSIALLDASGNYIIRTENDPPFCKLMFDTTGGEYCKKHVADACKNCNVSRSRTTLFECCNDIVSVLVPIISGGSRVGYIRCGQVFLTKVDAQCLRLDFLSKQYNLVFSDLVRSYLENELVPKSRLYAAAEATFAIAKYITDMATATFRKKELDDSRNSLITEQMAKVHLEKALRESDFKLLLSQINPHFLFNTLNTIAHMAYIDGAERVANLTWSLSDLLRSTLNKTEQLIPLKEEVAVLTNYLHIQTSRFGDRISFVLNIDPDLLDVSVPCMLLQPLVENAIIHGLERQRKKGYVDVTARKVNANIEFIIEDTGLGFNVADVKARKTHGLGLQSVMNRLKYYFGDQHRFQINSEVGKGAKIILSFPISGGGNHEKS